VGEIQDREKSYLEKVTQLGAHARSCINTTAFQTYKYAAEKAREAIIDKIMKMKVNMFTSDRLYVLEVEGLKREYKALTFMLRQVKRDGKRGEQ